MAQNHKYPLYIIKNTPVNRKEKRIAQKEYERIHKCLLPIIFAYTQEENKTDSLRLRAKEEYVKWLPKANNGNIFVTADPFFFDRNFPTKESLKNFIKPNERTTKSAWILYSIIIIFVILVLVSAITGVF